jgi:hypothetical protein
LKNKVIEKRGNVGVFMKLRWLAKALERGKDAQQNDAQAWRTVIAVRGGKGYASDGKRMHIVEHIGIDDGTYYVTKSNVGAVTLAPADARVPNYEALLSGFNALSEPVTVAVVGDTPGAMEGCLIMSFAKAFPLPHIFDLDYLRDALDIEESRADTYTFRWQAKRSAATLVVEYETASHPFYGPRKAVVVSLTHHDYV